MLANLQLSHLAMPTKLRLCSLFLAVFPEAAVIRRRHLVYWWIGEGLVTKTSTMTAEEAGDRAFLDLIDYGIIRPYYKTYEGPTAPPSACTVDPWVRQMLVSTARTSNFFDVSPDGKITPDCQESHRLIMGRAPNPKNKAPNGEPSTVDESHLRLDPELSSKSVRKAPRGEVLTVYNVDESHIRLEPEFFSKIENLKVIQLGRWRAAPRHHIEVGDEYFLKKLRTQKHLKYLSLRGISSVTSLPSSLSRCRNMVILDLRACHNLEKFPCDISSWRKLTHFIVSECYLLEELPKGLDRLPSLEVLKGVVIDHWRKNPCLLTHLSRLNTIRKLSLTVGMGEVVTSRNKGSRSYSSITGLFTNLSRLKNLRVLMVTWQMTSKQEVSNEEKLANTLSQPFASLEKLELRCYPGKELPAWFSPEKFEKLERLYIRGGKLERFPMVAGQWSFVLLRLNYLENLWAPPPLFNVSVQFPRLMLFERIIEVNSPHGKNRWETISWRIGEGWEVLKEKLRMGAKPFVLEHVYECRSEKWK